MTHALRSSLFNAVPPNHEGLRAIAQRRAVEVVGFKGGPMRVITRAGTCVALLAACAENTATAPPVSGEDAATRTPSGWTTGEREPDASSPFAPAQDAAAVYVHDPLMRSAYSCLGSPEGNCAAPGLASDGIPLLYESSAACDAHLCALYGVHFDADGCAAAYTLNGVKQSDAVGECVLRMWQGVRFSCAAGAALVEGHACIE